MEVGLIRVGLIADMGIFTSTGNIRTLRPYMLVTTTHIYKPLHSIMINKWTGWKHFLLNESGID